MSKNKPDYLQVAEFLSEKIRKSVYPPGGKLPSMKELSEKFQISESTAKTAFNILKQKNYIRYYHGVGMLVRDDLKFPVRTALILPCKYENLRELLQGMQEAMKAYSGTVEVMFYRNDIEQEKCLKSLKDNGYTGAVVRPDLSGSGYDMLRKLQEEEYPLVLLENLSPDSKSWCVDAGAFDAAGKAVGFFNKMDRLPIGVVYPPENFGYDFVEGYKKAHRELNIVCHRNCMRCVEKGTTAKNITLALMKIKDPPGSIIYAYPEYLIAAYKALKENTHALKNIKLLSFGTVPNSELFQYPVYSIKRNFLQLGQAAGELLKERIASTDNQRFPGKTKKLTPGVIS